MRKAIVSIVAVLAALLVLTGCGGSDSTSGQATGTGGVVRGGILRIGVHELPGNETALRHYSH